MGVRDLLALDEVATAAPTPGHWVAVDGSGGIIATDADAKRLVLRPRAQGTRADGVFRSATPDDSEPGGHGRL